MKVLQNNFVFWVEVSQLGGNLLRYRYLMCDTLALRYHEVSRGITRCHRGSSLHQGEVRRGLC